ncbi:MATE family efflux transporter [Natrinema soli]|uniref:MATE family efflux transporter n=1 Tax=Natrinema soli TaxID=1930624 RepID=A0ABD5STI1_9EURY|nr:MATE family efflux transporter [Natrinema soli]
MGFSIASSSLVGRHLSSEKRRMSPPHAATTSSLSLLTYVIAAVFVIVFARQIARLFVTDPAAINLAATFVAVTAVATIGLGLGEGPSARYAAQEIHTSRFTLLLSISTGLRCRSHISVSSPRSASWCCISRSRRNVRARTDHALSVLHRCLARGKSIATRALAERDRLSLRHRIPFEILSIPVEHEYNYKY